MVSRWRKRHHATYLKVYVCDDEGNFNTATDKIYEGYLKDTAHRREVMKQIRRTFKGRKLATVIFKYPKDKLPIQG